MLGLPAFPEEAKTVLRALTELLEGKTQVLVHVTPNGQGKVIKVRRATPQEY